MASLMKSVVVIQEVRILPRAKPSQQPSRETRWPEETKVRSRVDRVGRVCIEPRKLFESCGPARDKQRKGCLILSQAQPQTVSSCWNAVSAYAYMVRHGGGHRGRRPDHVGQGITRELGRASSASCLQNADQGVPTPRESTAKSKLLPRKGPLLRRVDPAPKRGDDRYEGTSRMAKEPRMGVRHS